MNGSLACGCWDDWPESSGGGLYGCVVSQDGPACVCGDEPAISETDRAHELMGLAIFAEQIGRAHV